MDGINLILTSEVLTLKMYFVMLHLNLLVLLQEKPAVLLVALVLNQISPTRNYKEMEKNI